MTDDELLGVLHAAADAAREALVATDDWGLAGTRPGQHRSDLIADDSAVAVLVEAGLGVVSEESGHHHADRSITVVVDPLDGSTNAAHRLSWWATSLCALDGEGARAAVVVDLVHDHRFDAVRGGGARRDGAPIRPSGAEVLGDAVVGVNGLPSRHLGWYQFRALGAAALDLCAVACGSLDGFVDCTDDGLAPWDYLGAMLVCQEAGATVADLRGRDLAVLDHDARRTVVAGATATLASALAAARRASPPARPPRPPRPPRSSPLPSSPSSGGQRRSL